MINSPLNCMDNEHIFLEISVLYKGGFISEIAIGFSNLQKNIPKNYPELEI